MCRSATHELISVEFPKLNFVEAFQLILHFLALIVTQLPKRLSRIVFLTKHRRLVCQFQV